MPEQGPTEAEITALILASQPNMWDAEKSPLYRAKARAALLAVEPLTRARHVREAVEAMPDAVLAGLGTQIRYAATYGIARAALLDALGGTDTTTPNPQNRP